MKRRIVSLEEMVESSGQKRAADRSWVAIAHLIYELRHAPMYESPVRVTMVDLDGRRNLELTAGKHALRLSEASGDYSPVLEVEGWMALGVIRVSDELGGCLVVDDGEKSFRLYPASADLKTADVGLRTEIVKIVHEWIHQGLVGRIDYEERRWPYEGVTISWRPHGQTDGEQTVEFPQPRRGSAMREAGEWIDRNRSDAAEMWLRWGSGRRMLIHRAATKPKAGSKRSESIDPVTVYWQGRPVRPLGRYQSYQFPNMAEAEWIEDARVGRQIIWLQWGTGRLDLVHWASIDGDWAGEGG